MVPTLGMRLNEIAQSGSSQGPVGVRRRGSEDELPASFLHAAPRLHQDRESRRIAYDSVAQIDHHEEVALTLDEILEILTEDLGAAAVELTVHGDDHGAERSGDGQTQ